MNDYESIGFEVVMLLGGAALLVLLVGAIRAVVEIIPVTRARREAFRRGLPMLATGLAVLYAVVCVRVLFAARPGFAAVGTGVVLLGFGVLVYGPMRDVISGVVLEAGRVCQVGDHVRLDELHGRIIKMGLRVLVLETSEGEEAVIPYSRVARERLLRTSGVESVSPHVFRVRAPASLSLAETKSLIRKGPSARPPSAISRVPEPRSRGSSRCGWRCMVTPTRVLRLPGTTWARPCDWPEIQRARFESIAPRWRSARRSSAPITLRSSAR